MGSTFYDLHRIQKETLTIDVPDGETSQKVNFSNENNLFKGTFVGNVEAGNVSFLSGAVDSLSSSYQKRGNYISCYNELSTAFKPVRIHGFFKNNEQFSFYVLSSL